uniref:Smoothelin-like protein 1 n=1 Tax=Sinocyclocheilus rhinocerous TaxID=307959 RepID=A0A673G9H5_9TELE
RTPSFPYTWRYTHLVTWLHQHLLFLLLSQLSLKMEGEKGTLEAGTKEQPDMTGPLTAEQLAAIEDEEILNNMLDKAVDFEERKMIRAAMRELLKRKRGEDRVMSLMSHIQYIWSAESNVLPDIILGESHKTCQESGLHLSQYKNYYLVCFCFPLFLSERRDRERAARMENLRQQGGGGKTSHVARVKVPGSSAVGGPNTKDVKQMLLDWCRVKTEPYEGVNIHNFSSSWADGLAFCALVHRFFSESFEYCTLDPYDRRANFEKAFKTAETLADCPRLLDVDDLMRMREPDWKCVYTYIQEFYRCLVEKGLVKTKKKMP